MITLQPHEMKIKEMIVWKERFELQYIKMFSIKYKTARNDRRMQGLSFLCSLKIFLFIAIQYRMTKIWVVCTVFGVKCASYWTSTIDTIDSEVNSTNT